MSEHRQTPPAVTTIDDLVSARLDGLIDDQAWAAACAEHGEALIRCHAQAHILRDACRADPLPALPADLLVQLRQQITTAPPNIDRGPQRAASSALWSWLAAGAVAAGLVGLLVPVLLPTSAEHTTPLTVSEERHDRSEEQSPALATLESADAASDQLLEASGVDFASERSESAAAPELPVALSAESEARSEAQDRHAPSSPSRQRIEPAEPARSLQRRTAEPDTAEPGNAEQGNAEQGVEDQDLETLIAEAEAFRAQHPQAPREAPQALPEAVVRDALAAEARAAEALSGDRLRITLAYTISPAEGADDAPLLVISMANRGEVEAPMGRDLLAIEGLDGDGQVVWELTLDAPEEILHPGKQWDWAYPLSKEQLPPASVRQTRLRYGPMRTASSPWPGDGSP